MIANHPVVLNAKKSWETLGERDRASLKILGVVLSALVIYFGIWVPAQSFMLEQRSMLETNKGLLVLVQTNQKMLAKSGRTGSQTAAGLDSQQLVSTVTNMATKEGLSLKRFEPAGEQKVKVWIEDSPFDKLVSWLTELERNLKVRVEQISIEKDEAEGLVSARLTLSS
jgi:general secretion pathway protein M